MIINNFTYTNELSPNANLVLGILWECRRKITHTKIISNTLGISQRQVLKAYKELIEKDYIIKKRENWNVEKGYMQYKYIIGVNGLKLYDRTYKEKEIERLKLLKQAEEQKTDLDLLFERVCEHNNIKLKKC